MSGLAPEARRLRILQVSTLDRGGGAEQVAWQLHQAYRDCGLDAWLAVGGKRSRDPHVLSIPKRGPPRRSNWSWWCHGLRNCLLPWESRLHGIGRVCRALRVLANGWEGLARRYGWEDYHHPGSHALLTLPPVRPDLVHAHNLHGGYFDLRTLAPLSQRLPLILTLHDAWLLSGHCAHGLGCERWRTGCGHCPDLTIYPAVPRDATALNWRRKRRIYAHSRLYVATPCHWLADQVAQSILAPAVIEARVIPNGVPTSIFRPADAVAARGALDLSPDRPLLLFVANGIRNNRFKDYPTLRSAIEQCAQTLRVPLDVIALGETAPEERIGDLRIRFIPHILDPCQVARYYQAADVYLHAARAETFPTTILEALACGTPVIATAVGGIPEQIRPNVTGLLVPPGDPRALADAISSLLKDPARRAEMSLAAAETARLRYALDLQVERYLDWYRAILSTQME